MTEKVDIYAFGILLWEILAERIPFDGLNNNTIKKEMLNGVKSLDFGLVQSHHA